MKRLSAFIAIVIQFTFQNSFAGINNPVTVLQQLEDLNKYWEGKNLNYEILKEKLPLTNDVFLIQMHLSLVEKTLRNKSTENLTAKQQQNRQKCLDILHDYWIKGIFPKNIYHSERTPYFIDHLGTACAVGQLIISTGHEKLAKKIMDENNYAYITELNEKYSEIREWADDFGFTLDELSWIQPSYGCINLPCPTGSQRNVSCYGGNDGCAMPDPSGQGWPAPYMYQWYGWTGSAWAPDPFGGFCDLFAGIYKAVITDGAGNTHDYFYTITQPSAITQTISFTNDNGSCNGTASVSVNGGTPGYTFLWSPGGQTSDSLSDLCQGTYTVTITDNNGCNSMETVTINLATEIENISRSSVSIFPNPVSKSLNLKLETFFVSDKTFALIYNSLGQQVFELKFETSVNTIDINHLDNGVYFIRIHNGTEAINYPFIKEK